MKPEERLKDYPRHPSVRGEVCYQLYKAMITDEDIWLITGDLGYKMFDPIKEDFPHRFINCGASEQAMMGTACGLALEGKKPFVYSITPFLIYRPFEWIRNYVNHENVPVRLLGGGLGKDYAENGFSHHCEEIYAILGLFTNIKQCWPKKMEDVEFTISQMVKDDSPWFMGIPR